jgi:hypothetical protein
LQAPCRDVDLTAQQPSSKTARMSGHVFERRVRLADSADEVFAWHARPGAFKRLTPPWERMEVVRQTGPLDEGMRVTMRVQAGPIRHTWTAEHVDVRPGRGFVDRQVQGPFARWEHTHRIEPAGETECTLIDHIEYALPLGALGRAIGGDWVRKKLERTFAYRHRIMTEDIAAHRRLRTQTGHEPLRIAITGTNGLIGSALVPFLTTGGHDVIRLVRRQPAHRGMSAAPVDQEAYWNPESGVIDSAALEDVDAVIHLAGENIGTGEWTEAKKAGIFKSRTEGTHLLARALAKLGRPPAVLVSASAIGFYDAWALEEVDESSPAGEGFLASVCQAWEAATRPAEERGVRVVHARMGIVLSLAGGVLPAMMGPFQLGAGGRIGSGSQWISWISLDDAAGALAHAAAVKSLSGPVNLVSPAPVMQADFARILARVLSRPTGLPLPAFAARLALGERAEILLGGARVRPSRLLESGHAFRQPDLTDALRHTLGR